MENKNLSVGEEMLKWAEKYWLLDKRCKGEIGYGEGEVFNYDYFRSIFIKGINGCVDGRLNPTQRPDSENSHSIE